MDLVKSYDIKLIHKFLTLLYINSKKSGREIKETIPFTTAAKRINT